MKRLLSVLLIVCFSLGAVSCAADTKPLKDVGALKISFDLSSVSAPAKAKIYRCSGWVANEDQVCKAFLKQRPSERKIFAPGPAYYVNVPAQHSEILNIYDQGRAYGTSLPEGGGFSYLGARPRAFDSGSLTWKDLYTNYLGNGDYARLRELENAAVKTDLPFGSLADARADLTKRLREAGLPEMEMVFAGGYTADVLSKLDISADHSAFTAEDDHYLFLFCQRFDGVPSLSYNLAFYTKDGIAECEANSSLPAGKALEEKKMLSAREAAAPLVKYYDGKTCRPELYYAQFGYYSLFDAKNKKNPHSGKLLPVWKFLVRETYHSANSQGNKQQISQISSYIVDGGTGKVLFPEEFYARSGLQK